MTEQERYYKKEYEEEYYIFDSKTLSEKEFEKKVEYDDYAVFADSLTPEEIIDLLNENEKLKEEKYAYLGEITLYKGESTKRKKENEDLKKRIEYFKEAKQEYKADWKYASARAEKYEDKCDSLQDENEELKQQLSDKTKNNVKLNISFMKFKIRLIEVLQQNYNYAYNQRQKNLDKSIVARNYELLYQTIDNIAETMNVDIERFPKGDGV